MNQRRSRWLRYWLWIVAAVAAYTGGRILVGGTSAVAPDLSGSMVASLDSELRFLAVSWTAVAVLAVWSSGDLQTRSTAVPAIGLLFAGGAIARLVSVLAAGTPDRGWVVAMIVEAGMAAVTLALHAWARPASLSGSR